MHCKDILDRHMRICYNNIVQNKMLILGTKIGIKRRSIMGFLEALFGKKKKAKRTGSTSSSVYDDRIYYAADDPDDNDDSDDDCDDDCDFDCDD